MNWSNIKVFGDLVKHNAERYQHKIAFVDPSGSETTFEAFHSRGNALNNAVSALGLVKGERIAILARNCTQYVESYGLSRSGLVVVPLNWRLTAAEIVVLVRHSESKLLIVDSEFADLIEEIKSELDGVRHFVCLKGERAGWLSYEELIAGASSVEQEFQVHENDVACLMYTSGTTGAPKGVAITHKGIIGNCIASAETLLGLTAEDVTLAAMPLFHAGGIWYHLFPSFGAGCTTVMLAQFDPGVVLRELERHQITNTHLVPTMIGALLNHPSISDFDASRLRLIFYAASSIPADLLKRAMHVFAGCGFVQAYGSTEGGILSVLTVEDHIQANTGVNEKLLFSCGRPIPGNSIQIFTDEDTTAAPMVIGEIVVRSNKIMQGYWNDDAADARVFSGGWLRTGDLGYFDDNGYLFLVDRKNDMIITGGENVFPTEVEEVIYRNPDILEAAVFGVPDPQWVEKVVAVIVLRADSRLDEGQILEQLRAAIAGYKCPKTIYLVDALPKNAVGKILRKELRKQYGSA